MKFVMASLAGALLLAATSAQAQRRSDADYAQGLQQSALAFAAQNQWRGADPSNRFIAGRRQAGRMYDESPAADRQERRPAYIRAYGR